MTASTHPATISPSPPRVLAYPELIYVIVIGCFYAWIASFTIGEPISIWAPNRDLWQHLAVLQVLIDSPFSPRNPFVDTLESSRSIGPYWVSVALAAREFGWTALEAFKVGAVINLSLLAFGIFAFARAALPSRWGPLALFAAMTIGWSAPLLHTGFHTAVTLIEGAGYPAVTMIAGALIAWALTIRLLVFAKLRPVGLAALATLVALLVANHQLGAGIALAGMGCYTLLLPGASFRNRAAVSAATVAGLLLATLWPYHNPFAILSEVSNSRWSATSNFYAPLVLLAIFVPSALGLWGLANLKQPTSGRPLIAAALLFALAFAAGASPEVPTGHRFSMPLVLVLQIGLAVLFLSIAGAEGAPPLARRTRSLLTVFFAVSTSLHVFGSYQLISHERAMLREGGSLVDAVAALLPEPKTDSGFAGFGITSWAVVASGRPMHSVPWPEPLIHDLTLRQSANAKLFDPNSSASERAALAARWKVHSLLVDSRIAPWEAVEALLNEGWAVRCAGPLLRFDLQSGHDAAAMYRSADCALARRYLENPISF